jgi:TatD DNase family protein
MLADTHCHLPTDIHQAAEQVSGAKEEGVVLLVNIGTSLEDSKEALAVANHFNSVYSAAAVYPHENPGASFELIRSGLSDLLRFSDKVVAVGECGIDISDREGGRSTDDQIELFKLHIGLALDNGLPLVLHNRNGDAHILEILRKYKGPALKGVAHCFSSDWNTASELMDLGFYISFSGMLTYPSRKDLVEVAKKMPLDRVLFETDAPYLPPQPHRGEKNVPKYVKIVAQKFAQVRELSFDAVSQYSFGNTCAIFNLSLPA